MPSTADLLKAYGERLIPKRIDGMSYKEASVRSVLDAYKIRGDLYKLYEHDMEIIGGGSIEDDC